MKKHNFFAGPSVLPDYTVEETAKAILDFNGTGISLMCMSHRDKSFDAVMNRAVELFKQVLDNPPVTQLFSWAAVQVCSLQWFR